MTGIEGLRPYAKSDFQPTTKFLLFQVVFCLGRAGSKRHNVNPSEDVGKVPRGLTLWLLIRNR
jgi:hypothetical protein